MIQMSIRHFLLIMIGFICINCHSDTQQSQGKKAKGKLEKDSLRDNGKNYVQIHRGGTKRDTLVLNQQKLIRLSNDRYFEAIINMAGDTIIPGADYCHRAEFLDINNDKWTDVRVFEYSNTPNVCQNYFFDPKSQTFRRVEGEYLDIENIKGTGLYYSYNSAGCADANWESHLTRIENWTQVTIGEMLAKGCGEKDDGIYIYKVNDEKQTLVRKLPIVFGNDKWPFLVKYWKKNHHLFCR